MSKATVRPATREDIERFSDLPNKPTLKAWVGEVDGEIVALGGFAFSKGRWFAFGDLREAGRPHKFAIVRAAKMIMNEARRQGIRFIYAEAAPNEPGSKRWLASLGFKPDPRSLHFYRWQGDQ